MHELDTNQSITATVCEQAALFGTVPDRDDFDSREVWDQESALSAVTEAFGIIARCVAPDGTQLADERESLLLGLREHAGRPDPAPGPGGRQAHPGDEGPPAGAGRLGDPLQGAGAGHRPGKEPHRTKGRLRADEGHGGRGLPSRDRGCVAAQAGISYFTDRTPHIGHDRGPGLPEGAQGPGESPPSCHRERWLPWQEGSRPRTLVSSSVTWTGSRPSTTTWSWSMEEGRVSRRSRPSGRTGTACTRSCASPTGTPTAGRRPSAGTTSFWTCCPRG